MESGEFAALSDERTGLADLGRLIGFAAGVRDNAKSGGAICRTSNRGGGIAPARSRLAAGIATSANNKPPSIATPLTIARR
jgi:hypothetical protein